MHGDLNLAKTSRSPPRGARGASKAGAAPADGARLEAMEQRLRELTRQLVAVQENERRHLAREIHDEIGQALTAAMLAVRTGGEWPTQRDKVEKILNGLIQRVRDVSLNLRPSILDDLGLAPALRWYVERQGKLGGFEARLDLGLPGGRYSQDVETACFRIVQEALTNVTRHAQARKVRVRVDCVEGAIEMEVRDDGAGFAPQRPAGFGVAGMRERAESLGGTLEVTSQQGGGTRVAARIPLECTTAAPDPT